MTYQRARAAAKRLAAESVDRVEKAKKALVPGLNPAEEARLKEALRRAEAARWDTPVATFAPHQDPRRTDPEARPRDPFRALWLTQEAMKRDSLTVAEVVPLAQDCLNARALVPSADNYLFLKKRLAHEAGTLANRAAAAEAGPDGFRAPNKNLNSAAGVAYRAWEAFAASERLDKVRTFNGATVAHQQAIAYAQAGYRGPAYRAIQVYLTEVRDGKRTPPTRADVWYDFARVCALRIDERLSQPSPDLPLSLFCLRMAKYLGSNKVDEAIDGVEFEYVRKAYGRERLKAALDIPRLSDD